MLPIEVMGPPASMNDAPGTGYVETVKLTLDPGEGTKAARLRVKAHNVSYRKKGYIRVNGGSWFMLWNDVSAIKMAKPDRAYGGFGGGFSTITFNIETPDVDFRDGENTIEFEYHYKHDDHGTAGFRIVYLDIRDAENRSLLPSNATTFDDPRTWKAPEGYEGPYHIAEGKRIWQTSGGENGPSCMNCHTDTGRDLKYYNVSNKTIIEQCKKSGFSPVQGRQVASYIRSIDIPVLTRARPWNPPYQPGPGTDGRSAYEWAAGAGLDAVLRNDAEMLPYMFGTGTQEEIDAATDIGADMNLRDMPIAVQFPDWIHWIPRIHPIQLWGREYWENECAEKDDGKPLSERRNNPYQSYLDLKEQFENGLATSPDLVKNVKHDFQRNVLWWIDPGDKLHPWCEQEGKILDEAKSNGHTAEVIKLNLSRWRAVKLWGLFNTYDAQDKAADLIPTAEKYQWPAELFSVFQIAAHFIGDDRGTSCFKWEAPEVGIYFSSIWYQLQMVLNSGMRQGGAVAPIDWAYNYAHINLMGDVSGIYEPLRMVQNLIKGYQQRHIPNSPIGDATWTMREVSPWRLYSNFDGDQTTYQTLDSYGLGEDLRMRILKSMLTQFLRKANEYESTQWPRTAIRKDGGDSWWQIMVPTYVPVQNPDEVSNNRLFVISGIGDAIDADAMYRLIPRLRELGLSRTLVQKLSNWCAEVWPGPSGAETDWNVTKADFELTILSEATAEPAAIVLVRGMATSEKIVKLGVIAEDPNDDQLMYRWEMIDGPRDVDGKLRHQFIENRERANVMSSALNTVGNYEFEVVVDDGSWEKRSSVEVVVTSPDNTAPRSIGQSVTTERETPVGITLRGTDTENDVLTYRIVEEPLNGTLSGTGANVRYTPAAGFSGTDFFRFTVEDGEVHSVKSMVKITVFSGIPIADEQSKTTDFETPVDIVLSGSDQENDALTYRIVEDPLSGSLSRTGSKVTYTPDNGFSGADSFSFVVNDGTDDSDEAEVSITVLANPNNPGTPGTPVDPDDPGCGGCSATEGRFPAGWLMVLGVLALMFRARYVKSC